MSTGTSPQAAEAASTLNVTPAQRAAVVIAMLGETAAKPIVELLDDAAMTNVAASLESITYLSKEQLVEIVIDFLRQLRKSSGSMRGGADEAKKIMSSLVDEPRLNVIYGTAEPTLEETMPEPETREDYSRIWIEMSKRDNAHIAKYLSGLTPNIIALILRNLDTTLCSQLLCLLEEDIQTLVLGEMVDPPPPSHEIDSVIARMVRMEFLLVPESEDEDDGQQLQSVGEMLSLVPGERRTPLMDYLNQSHASKVDPIQKGMFEIAHIPLVLNRNQVPILFKALDQNFIISVLSYLQGQYPEVAEYFLSNISNRMADQFKAELEIMSPPTGADAELIERKFLTEMMDMKRNNVIEIGARPAEG